MSERIDAWRGGSLESDAEDKVLRHPQVGGTALPEILQA